MARQRIDIEMLETVEYSATVSESIDRSRGVVKNLLLPALESQPNAVFASTSEKNKFVQKSSVFIAKSIARSSVLSTIVFPNQPKLLEDLYIPLTIESQDDSKNKIKVVIDDKNVFDKAQRIFVSDNAGMGKSTLSKKVVLVTFRSEKSVPIFIELRNIKAGCIARQISKLLGLKVTNYEELLSKLPLTFIFDGMDEVALELQKTITENLIDFSLQMHDANILITSRKEGFSSSFANFHTTTICSLSVPEACELIKKYDQTGDYADALIAEIQTQNHKEIFSFLGTPLYATLLFSCYKYKTVVPKMRYMFYEQLYNSLFFAHDLSKEISFVRRKHSGLDSNDFETILRRLAFYCLANSGLIEFSLSELESIVKSNIESVVGVKCKPVDFVKDLHTTVPLFVKDGSSVRWVHKSIMEYFATGFICRDSKKFNESMLLKMYETNNRKHYLGVFEFCSEMDFPLFRSVIIKQILCRYKISLESTENQIANPKINDYEKSVRLGCMFYGSMYIAIINASVAFRSGETVITAGHSNYLKLSDFMEHSKLRDDSEVDPVVVHKGPVDIEKEKLGKVGEIKTTRDSTTFGIVLCDSRQLFDLTLLKVIKDKVPELFLSFSKAQLNEYNKAYGFNSLNWRNVIELTSNGRHKLNSARNMPAVNYFLLHAFDYLILCPNEVMKELDEIENFRDEAIEDMVATMFANDATDRKQICS